MTTVRQQRLYAMAVGAYTTARDLRREFSNGTRPAELDELYEASKRVLEWARVQHDQEPDTTMGYDTLEEKKMDLEEP